MAKYLLLWGGTGYESTAVPRIHVVGDFWSTAPQPKAGHMGNQQGKLGTDAIVRLLSDQPLDPAPATDTVEFSPIIADTAAWFTTVFHVAWVPTALPRWWADLLGNRPARRTRILSVCSSGLLSCTRTRWPRLRGGVN